MKQSPLTLRRWGRVEYERLEVYREPGADVTAVYGWRYLSVQRFGPPRSALPLEVPTGPIPVAALLP
jgi:hypothetical protein